MMHVHVQTKADLLLWPLQLSVFVCLLFVMLIFFGIGRGGGNTIATTARIILFILFYIELGKLVRYEIESIISSFAHEVSIAILKLSLTYINLAYDEVTISANPKTNVIFIFKPFFLTIQRETRRACALVAQLPHVYAALLQPVSIGSLCIQIRTLRCGSMSVIWQSSRDIELFIRKK